MECVEFKPMVQAFVDGEFDEREEAEARLHLEQCPDCRRLARHHAQMRQHFKAACTPDVAPQDLRERLTLALAQHAQQEEEQEEALEAQAAAVAMAANDDASLPEERQGARRYLWALGPMVAAAAAVALMLNFGASEPQQEAPTLNQGQAAEFVSAPADRTRRPADMQPIVEASVSWHRRNLPPEVIGPSGDRVRTWLRPKVDFPVRLPRFERTGREDVSLLGARLSHVREKQAAYVVYEVDGNKISVMLVGGDRRVRLPPRVRHHAQRQIYTANGYNVAVIEDNGVTYSVTSEMPREDMAQLVEAAFSPQ